MLEGIINWSLEHRWVVVFLSLILAATGIQALWELPIDAFPDTTPVQVQINTAAPALSPLEIERQVTFAVEQAIAGIPALAEARSISKFGFSQVTAVFADGTDVYFARQQVVERLAAVELPEGIARPELGPVATGLGEIYHYLVTAKGKDLRELTTIHDWMIRPRLRSVRGVAEVNTWGGERKQHQVLIDIDRLIKHDLTLDDVFAALRRNNLAAGGGSLTRAGEQQLVHGLALVASSRDIGDIVIASRDGFPVRIRDVGAAVEGHAIRRGAATAGGNGEVVLGLGFMLLGENSHRVMRRLEAQMEEVRRELPEGVEVRPVYERTELVDRVFATVKENLSAGAILVVAVLFAFLGNLRAGLIVAAAIPLSMLFAFNAMLRCGIAGTLMSLGAIDFGLIVDSSVILVENGIRRLSEDGGRRPMVDVIRRAALEVRRPTMFGELIIAVVYLPVLLLEGVEGKLFRPMALTIIFALLGSLILSLTLMPALSSLLLPRRPARRQNPLARGAGLLVRGAQALYRPVLRLALGARTAVIIAVIYLLAGGAFLASQLGSEFLPRLSEMAIVLNTVRLAGVSLEESVRYGTRIEEVIRERFPAEVRDVWTRTGTAAVATDPMGIEVSDIFITLQPRRHWTRARTQEELERLLERELSGLPGMRVIPTQPIEMRLNEMTAGIRADLGVKIFGDDLDILKEKAADVEAVLRSLPGAVDVVSEQISGLPVLEVAVDREAIARHGLDAAAVMEIVEAIGGRKIGEVQEGERRFDLVVRLAERHRSDPDAIGRILVSGPGGERIPLARLSRIREVVGPSTITREGGSRRIVVQTSIRGRDTGGFVEEARERIAREVVLPDGYSIRYGGQFQHLERARTRLWIIIPAALILVLVLLGASTRSLRDALLIFTGAPFAALGGVAALAIRGMPFTISAGVGFVAVSGVSMLNGLVLVSTIRRLLDTGRPLPAAIEESALLRLRPILMTALVASLGFIPMALNTGVGAEVQRPLATVVIGGVVSDNLLTLVVLPVLYSIFGGGSNPPRKEENDD